MLGGPGNNGTFVDSRQDYQFTEPAVDYNAPLAGVCPGCQPVLAVLNADWCCQIAAQLRAANLQQLLSLSYSRRCCQTGCSTWAKGWRRLAPDTFISHLPAHGMCRHAGWRAHRRWWSDLEHLHCCRSHQLSSAQCFEVGLF
jgi:hypothetical protein